MKTGRKMIALALAAVLSVSTAGCVTEDLIDIDSKTGKETSGSAKPGKQDPAKTGYDGTAPVFTDTFNISVLLEGTAAAAAQSVQAESVVETSGQESGEAAEAESIMPAWIKEIEEKANVKLDLEFTDAAFYADETAKRLAAGTDLPDLLKMPSMDTDIGYIRSGRILDLTDFYSGSVHLYDQLDKYPALWTELATPEGRVYYLPEIADMEYGAQGLMVNRQFRLRLLAAASSPTAQNNSGASGNAIGGNSTATAPAEVPEAELAEITTVSQFVNVLKEFRDGDANGNGSTSDEVPFFLLPEDAAGMGALFGLDLVTGWTEAGDGTVVFEYKTDAYREYLSFMHGLYEDGLIYQDFAAADSKKADELIKAGRVGAMWQAFSEAASDSRKADSSWRAGQNALIYQPLAPLDNEKGYKSANVAPEPVQGLYAITSSCADPEKVFWFCDYLYSDEAGAILKEAGPKKSAAAAIAAESPADAQRIRELGAQSYVPVRTLWVLPEEQETVNVYGNDLEGYCKRTLVDFITGKLTIDDGTWETYLFSLKGLGEDQITALRQAQADRR